MKMNEFKRNKKFKDFLTALFRLYPPYSFKYNACIFHHIVIKKIMSTKFNVKTFQGMILALQEYWANQGCTVVQPFDMEVGAGTSHPMTALRALGPEPMAFAYVQPSSSDRWSLWRKPKPFTTLLSIPSGD